MEPHTALLWLSFIWLSCVGVNASCPSLNINYPARRTLLCPGDSITYTCVLNSPYYVVHMQWTGPAFQCTPAGLPRNAITFSQLQGFSDPAVITCGNFSAVMTNVSGTCYTSVLTIPTPQYYNGTTIQCKDGTDGTVSGSDTLDIQLAVSPKSLVIAILFRSTSPTYGTTNLTMAWCHDAGGVPTKYLISINVTGYSPISVNSSSMTSYTYTFTNLSSTHVYMITVMATNCAGSITVSRTEASLNNLVITSLSRSSNPTYGTSNITMDWSHDAGSVPTTYVIIINATGYGPVTVNSTSMMSYTYTFTNLSSSHVYMITVMATNCAGSITVSRTEVFDDLLLPASLISAKATLIRASTISTTTDMLSPSGSYSATSTLTADSCTPAAGFAFCTFDNSFIGFVVGISVSVSFVVSFLGMLVACILCYILRRSKESYKPSSHVDLARMYDEVVTNKKTNGDVIE